VLEGEEAIEGELCDVGSRGIYAEDATSFPHALILPSATR
jgi:hypothetical protein